MYLFSVLGCDNGTYGENCTNECAMCHEDTVCNHMTGYCDTCASGYEGSRCETGKGQRSNYILVLVLVLFLLFVLTETK